MRALSSLAVLALVVLAAGCSRRKAVDPQLDLVLDGSARRAPVASALELAGEAKATRATPSHSGATAPLHAHRKARTRSPAPRPQQARGVEHAPAAAREPQPPIAAAPVPVQSADPAPAPAPEPAAPQPEPQVGHGGGGWSAPTDGGIHLPGFPGGGVIIIRGGHSGRDPCDEHDRRGVGGGIFPGIPGRVGHGFPGGIRF